MSAVAGYVVEVVENGTDTVTHTVGDKHPMSYNKAEKVADGMNINLDHARFYTRITRVEWEAA